MRKGIPAKPWIRYIPAISPQNLLEEVPSHAWIMASIPQRSTTRATVQVTSKKKEGNESHNDDAVHIRALAKGNGDSDCSGSGADSVAPASVGRIHDVFPA